MSIGVRVPTSVCHDGRASSVKKAASCSLMVELAPQGSNVGSNPARKYFMKAHNLAKVLLSLPDVDVLNEYWSFPCVVHSAYFTAPESYNGEDAKEFPNGVIKFL